MPVEVIGAHAQLRGGGVAHAHHFRGQFRRGQGRVLQVQAAGAFDGQGMNGEALRGQLPGPRHGAGKVRQVLPGQPGDHVHVDMVKAHLPGHGIGVINLRHRMPAADDLQGRSFRFGG